MLGGASVSRGVAASCSSAASKLRQTERRHARYRRPVDELAWIADATGRRVERGERIQSLWSGYGELYRVRLDGAPAIVKSVRPPAGERSVGHRRKCRSYDVELAWYQRYAAECPARVPTLIAGARLPEGWLFVLEDLDAAGFPRRRGPIEPCLAWLARFHARYLGVAPDGLWELGSYWHLDTRRDELARIEPALREAAPVLDARLRAARHQTLVHGDAKLANFCFGDAGVAAVDFQYVGGGPGVRDVAYLLCGLPDEARLLDVYFSFLAEQEVEREWRALYPIAVADFYRFLAGWAPEHYQRDPHAVSTVRAVLRALR